MDTKTVWCDVQDKTTGEIVGKAEVCTIIHEGKEYTSGGAFVTPTHAIGYPKQGKLLAWDGSVLGTCRTVARWATPRSFVSSHMEQIEATINGVTYTGRGGGDGLLWRGKRKAKQPAPIPRCAVCGEETTHVRESSMFGCVHRFGPRDHDFVRTCRETQ